jgi:hypothetical protein
MNSMAKIQKLRLDRDVEAGDDFVGDQDFRQCAQGASDVDALALPARQLAGKPRGEIGR